MHPKTKHQILLNNNLVRRWYENLNARSEITTDNYLGNLGLWLERTGLTPSSLLEISQKNYEDLKNKISDQIRFMENSGKAGSYISVSLKPLISFLKFHNIQIKLQINIKNEKRNLTTENERIPTREELSSMMRNATPRSRLEIALISYSGLRPESIGTYRGNDGLKIGDIRDLKIENNKAIFKKTPALITIRPELSKARHQYFSFLTEEGCIYATEYLNSRLSSKEELTEASPLIKPNENKSRKETGNNFLETQLVSREIKRAITKAGFKWRPYVLRAYFATNLDLAENKGDISHSWRQFFMGHKGDIKTTYSTKKKISDDIIDEMREAYRRCEKYFATQTENRQREDLGKKLREYTIMMFETTFNVLLTTEKKEELYKLSLEEFQEDLKKIAKEKKSETINRGNRQQIILLSDIEKYINEGWEYVTTLPEGKAIIKIPKEESQIPLLPNKLSSELNKQDKA